MAEKKKSEAIIAFEFRPLWLLAVLLILGASLAYLAWLQGTGLPPFPIPALELGGEGSVLHYAGMVLNRSFSAAYPALMLYFFCAFLIYAGIQILGLILDARCRRRFSAGVPVNNLPTWLAISIAPILGRPNIRFIGIADWSTDDWRTYVIQAPSSLLSPIRLAVQTFPLFGFVGTIAGIASALKYLPTGENTDASIGNLTASLYTAFDTTFIGLIASLALMLLGYGMENAWARIQVAVEGGIKTRIGP